jgi:hypothetical protein
MMDNMRNLMSNLFERYFFRVILINLFLGVAFLVYMANVQKPYNSTDNKALGIRSGMMLSVDNGTGCEYLMSISGGIIPRMNADGKQICRKK